MTNFAQETIYQNHQDYPGHGYLQACHCMPALHNGCFLLDTPLLNDGPPDHVDYAIFMTIFVPWKTSLYITITLYYFIFHKWSYVVVMCNQTGYVSMCMSVFWISLSGYPLNISCAIRTWTLPFTSIAYNRYGMHFLLGIPQYEYNWYTMVKKGIAKSNKAISLIHAWADLYSLCMSMGSK